MATVLLVLVVVLVVAALVFGVVSLLTGDDPGLVAVEADGRALPLPNNRSLTETDLKTVRFDLGLRGYRMAQVDRVLRRTAYDVGYKDEMIAVLEAEVTALREGRAGDAEQLRQARESAADPASDTALSYPSATILTGKADDTDEGRDEHRDETQVADLGGDQLGADDPAAFGPAAGYGSEASGDVVLDDESGYTGPGRLARPDVTPDVAPEPRSGADQPPVDDPDPPSVEPETPAGPAAGTPDDASDDTVRTGDDRSARGRRPRAPGSAKGSGRG